VLHSSLHALELPDTVQAVIRARLDRLDREARELLRLAAVVGREFSRGILERTLPEGIRSGMALARLKAAGLIQQRQVVPEPAYRFKHVLTQEVAYSSLLEHQRRELHARVGEALEQLGSETGNHQFDRLAHHFSRAGEWEKAVHYGVRSAERDESLAQFSEALRLLERTQRWLRQLPEGATRHGQLVEILLRQERLCETLGLRGRQQRIIDELLLLLDADADGPKLAEVQVRQGDLFTLLRRFDAAEQALDRALAAYFAMVDSVGERNTLRSLGLLRWHQGRNEEALGAIEQALEIDRQRGTVEAIVGDLSNLASVLKSMGEFDRARVQLEEALDLSERGNARGAAAKPADLHVKRAYILHYLANVYRELGDNAAALEHLHRAVTVSREKRLPIQASFHYTAIAHILLQESRIEDSLHYYREAVGLTRRARFVPGLSQALRILGEVLLGLGRRDEALPPLLEAAGLFGQLKDRATEARIWSNVATIHERDARLAEALAAWGKARALCRKEKHSAGEMEALEGLARVTRRHVAEPSLALEYVREALALARGSSDAPSEGRLRNTIGILEWGQGNYREALRNYTRSLEVYRQLGDDVSAGLMLNSIGVTLQALGRWDDACRSLTEAIELHRRTAQRQLEAHALGALGDVRCELGQIAQAIEAFEHSLQIRTEIGDRRGEGWMLHHLAKARLLLGESEAAFGRLERAERLGNELDDPELTGACEELRSAPPL
jgi:tetratricopeptide (TPR) repeat protein